MEYPMVINANQARPIMRPAPVVADDGQQNETWYGWMDEGFNPVHEHPVARDTRKRIPCRISTAGPELRLDQRERERAADDVERELRGPMYSFQTYSKTR
jgi:hypothetical protein